jgi:hypothetical protein
MAISNAFTQQFDGSHTFLGVFDYVCAIYIEISMNTYEEILDLTSKTDIVWPIREI